MTKHYSLDLTDMGERTLRSNQKQTLRDRVMRGLGYGSHIERSVVSFRLTQLPPVSQPLCVECTLKPLKEASTPRASWRVSSCEVFETIA